MSRASRCALTGHAHSDGLYRRRSRIERSEEVLRKLARWDNLARQHDLGTATSPNALTLVLRFKVPNAPQEAGWPRLASRVAGAFFRACSGPAASSVRAREGGPLGGWGRREQQ